MWLNCPKKKKKNYKKKPILFIEANRRHTAFFGTVTKSKKVLLYYFDKNKIELMVLSPVKYINYYLSSEEITSLLKLK